jgi:hypothetical protein
VRGLKTTTTMMLVLAAASALIHSTSAHDATTPREGAVGIIAIGHSGLTGANSAEDYGDAYENSWATGTNPEVVSIYERLVAVRPETEGYASNEAVGGAVSDTLAEQATAALAEVPNPALVIIQTIDNDIRCDGSDEANVSVFGEHLDEALTLITNSSPDSHILVLEQQGRPATYAAMLMDLPEDNVGGTGMCDFFDYSGRLVPEALDTLTGIIEAYEAEQARVCATYPQCQTDGGVLKAYVDAVDDYSTLDLNHASVTGLAHKAEMLWPVVADMLGLPSEEPSGSA